MQKNNSDTYPINAEFFEFYHKCLDYKEGKTQKEFYSIDTILVSEIENKIHSLLVETNSARFHFSEDNQNCTALTLHKDCDVTSHNVMELCLLVELVENFEGYPCVIQTHDNWLIEYYLTNSYTVDVFLPHPVLFQFQLDGFLRQGYIPYTVSEEDRKQLAVYSNYDWFNEEALYVEVKDNDTKYLAPQHRVIQNELESIIFNKPN